MKSMKSTQEVEVIWNEALLYIGAWSITDILKECEWSFDEDSQLFTIEYVNDIDFTRSDIDGENETSFYRNDTYNFNNYTEESFIEFLTDVAEKDARFNI